MKKRSKKSQVQSQTFVYMLVAIILGFLLMISYKTISNLGEKKTEHEMILFQENIKKDINAWALHIGSVGEESYTIPSFITRACFVDLSRREEILNQGFLDEYPLFINSLETTNNNMFLFDEEDTFYNSVYVGDVTLLNDYKCQPFTCFDATNNVLELLIIGKGNSALLLPANVERKHVIGCKCPGGCKIRPIADFTFEGNMQYIDVVLDSSDSYDLDDYITEYLWDFGDGKNKTTTEQKTKHTYKGAMDYPITLTVTDVDGLKGIIKETLTIIPYSLFAEAGQNKTSKIGEVLVFNASSSIGNIVSYSWTLGDLRSTVKLGETVEFYYYQSGSKLVTLTVKDIFGNEAIDTLGVEVTR